MNPMQPDSLNPFLTLQRNSEELFNQIQTRNASKMVCQSGCSKCCHAEFSIFMGEALVIVRWFETLSPETQKEVTQKWEVTATEGACAFLRNDRCSIYEARPIICRTQGAPLSFSIQKKNEIQKTVDACPLNFEAGKTIPKSNSDWFDLDRLTSLQAIAENFTKKSFEIPADLAALCDKNERIPLRTLQAHLSKINHQGN